MRSLAINELGNRYIDNADFLAVSQKTKNENIYSSKKIMFSNISDQLTDHLKKSDKINVFGQWSFDKPIIIKTENIKDKDSLINQDYLSASFNPVIESLRKELYEKEHIPSHVGEIIFSKTLKTIEKVRKVYGQYTSWEPICGRFIYAANGIINPNQTTGGHYTVDFTINHLPKHAHRFIPDNADKTFKFSHTYSPIGGKGYTAYIQSGSYNLGGNETAYPVKNEDISRYFCGQPIGRNAGRGTPTGYADLYGNSGPDVLIPENTGKNVNYAILPPFITVFIWRRTS